MSEQTVRALDTFHWAGGIIVHDVEYPADAEVVRLFPHFFAAPSVPEAAPPSKPRRPPGRPRKAVAGG